MSRVLLLFVASAACHDDYLLQHGTTPSAPWDTDTSQDGPSPVATLSGGVVPLLARRCAPCHTRERVAGLQLDDDPHAELVGVPSTQVPSLALVEPGDRSASYLYLKCADEHDAAGREGAGMPPTRPLDGAELALLGAWIDEGAEDD